MSHILASNHYLRAVNWIVERITGDDIEAWLGERIKAGDSYRTIARDLCTVTDGVVDVSAESVRRWVLDFQESRAA